MSGQLVVRRVEVAGQPDRQVLVENGRVARISGFEPVAAGVEVVDGQGGALIRGLNDHHVHLFALAAADHSVPCGPPEVTDRDGLARALRSAAQRQPPGEWLRGVGYDDESLGVLTAIELDHLLGDLADRPVRIAHRSGHAWLLNSEARHRLGLGPGGSSVGGALSGRLDPGSGLLLDGDDRLRETLGGEFPDLGAVSLRLARAGITGVTDAGAHNGPAELTALRAAAGRGELRQRCLVLGGPDLPGNAEPGGRAEPGDLTRLVQPGAMKIVLADHELPGLDDVVGRIVGAGPRGVALHAASLESMVLAVAALSAAPGDGRTRHRVEHASIAPPPLVSELARLRVRVITQPGFVHRHGDRYRRSVEPADQPWLYRLRGWLDAGVSLGAGSDAPYGPEDPWTAIRTAVNRRTSEGYSLGAGEAVSPEAALAMFTGSLLTPGTAAGPLAVGDPADLCLLALPWRQARAELTAELVRCTLIGGHIVLPPP